MNISGSTANPSTTHQSILKSANKQPELALQLLQKSLAGTTNKSAQPAKVAASPATVQQTPSIDIYA